MSDRFPLCSSWATVDEAKLCGSGFPECTDDDQIEKLLQSSTYLLYLLSKKRYPGICTDEVRPPDRGCCCLPVDPCRCSTESKVRLGAYPIRSIVSVEIDGEILDPSEYDVENRRFLVRMADVDGKRQTWPRRQRLDLPLGEDGTWSVTFTYGQDPPQPGVDAAVAYARELAKACACDTSCKLPSRVQTVARQGVSLVIGDPLLWLRGGLTGVASVDSWLAAENFAGRQRSSFLNPDLICAQVSRMSADPWQS